MPAACRCARAKNEMGEAPFHQPIHPTGRPGVFRLEAAHSSWPTWKRRQRDSGQGVFDRDAQREEDLQIYRDSTPLSADGSARLP